MVDQRSRDRPARLLPALDWLGHYQRAGLLDYALVGSSRQLVVSPTSATAAISAALVAPCW